MTKLLQQVLAEIAKLPPKRQDELAAVLAEELAAEDRWDRTFASSPRVLEGLAEEALKEFREGGTTPFNSSTLSGDE